VVKATVRSIRGKTAFAEPGQPPTIGLPKSMMTERVLLHELAHLVTPLTLPKHGPDYARTYLELVRQFMGLKVARRLTLAFLVYEVRVGPRERRAI
jgi:putative metallohydrolase (TIGR04338 family)